MSSLMQFGGKVDRRGVHLQAYQVNPKISEWTQTPTGPKYDWAAQDLHLFACPKCQRWHPRLFTFVRKPKGMFGCWVVFRYNGKDQVPDLSCPLSLEKLPRGAEPMSLVESMNVWHS